MNRGFLLVEVCISLLILGIMLEMLAFWQRIILEGESKIAQRAHLVMAGRSLTERYRATGVRDSCPEKGITVTLTNTPFSLTVKKGNAEYSIVLGGQKI